MSTLLRFKSLLVALAIFTPPLMTLLLIQLILRVDWRTYTPYYSDEISYASVGFSGGYYTVDEMQPVLSASPFGAHGPFYPMIMGSLTRLLPQTPVSIVLANLLLLSVSTAAFIALIRPTIQQLILLIITLNTAWVLLLMIPMAMQESFHFSVAIILAGVWTRLLRDDRRWRFHIAFFVVLLVASLVRPSWALLYLPYFLAVLRPHSLPAWATVAGLSGGMAGLAFILSRVTWAPYPDNSLSAVLTTLSSDVGSGIRLWLEHVQTNLSALFKDGIIPTTTRLFALAGVVLAGLGGLLKRSANRSQQDEIAFHLCNLALIFSVIFLFYDFRGWRDTRTLAPHLLLSVLVVLGVGNRGLLIVYLVLNLMGVVSFVGFYQDVRQENFPASTLELDEFEQRIARLLVYDSQAESAWCNTLLTSLSLYGPHLLRVPPGIGISTIFLLSRLEAPPQSRYLLLNEASHLYLQERADLIDLAHTAFGTFYLNQDSGCDDTTR